MREYGPEGFWWEQMMKAGQRVEPSPSHDEAFADFYQQVMGERPPAKFVAVTSPTMGILLCMRHRKRASECGCLAGGY